MFEWLERLLLGNARSSGRAQDLAALNFQKEPDTIYAIGDVHGCLGLLKALEELLSEDARSRPGEKWLVMLGDYIDRGPESAGVLDHLLGMAPAGLRRICLAGNHEIAMLQFLAKPSRTSPWLSFGGLETLLSYGINEAALTATLRSRHAFADLVRSHIPIEHREFLEHLPMILTTPTHIFVHAGLRPAVPIEQQKPDDLLWIRHDFSTDYAEFGKVVVHGHSPTPEVFLSDHHISVDTGAYLSGRLSAVRLCRGSSPRNFSSGAHGHPAGRLAGLLTDRRGTSDTKNRGIGFP